VKRSARRVGGRTVSATEVAWPHSSTSCWPARSKRTAPAVAPESPKAYFCSTTVKAAPSLELPSNLLLPDERRLACGAAL
jgi:hypothetical protein